MKQVRLRPAFAMPLVVAFCIITIGFGTVYAVGQQVLRMSANDPQIQLAEDAARQLDQGADPGQVAGGNIPLGASLSPFVVVYNLAGTPVAGNGYLGGKLPEMPFGVLKAAAGNAYHGVTWQPASGLRFAAVSVAAKRYYVVSARSITEVEQRETQVLRLSTIGWSASVIVLLVAALLALRKAEK